MRRLLAVGFVMICVIAATAATEGQVPDAQVMSGIPRIVDDLPAGTVGVRVVRVTLTRPAEGAVVELTVNQQLQKSLTDAAGRVEFAGLPAGSPVRVAATVDGHRIESAPFEMPSERGVRVLLVAPREPARGAAASETPGSAALSAAGTGILLGGDSRIVIEFADDSLEIYYLFEIINRSDVLVALGRPLVFVLPAGAQAIALLEDSSPQSRVEGRSVVVSGPFQSGSTLVRAAYTLPISRGRATIDVKLPAAWDQVTVIARRVGSMRLSSAAIQAQQEMPSEGRTYLVGTGPSVPEGRVLTVELSGLPSRVTWPRDGAIILGFATLLAGAWAAARGPRRHVLARSDLERQREEALEALVALHDRSQRGEIDPSLYRVSRERLMATLERIYEALDDIDAGCERGVPEQAA